MTEAARGHLAMLVFSACVAGSFSLGSMAANHIAPLALNSVRFVLAAVLLAVVALATTGIPASAARAPWRYLVLGGLFSTYFVLMFEGLKTGAPVSMSAVFTLTPALSAVFGYVMLRQVTTPRMAFALSIGAMGALWVIFRADVAALLAFEIGRGEVIFFVGCIAHAIYAPMVRVLNRGETPLVFSLGMLVAGAAMMGLWGWRDILGTDWFALPPIVWITLVYVAVFASAASFVLLQFAVLRLPSAKVMAYTYLVPSWVSVWEISLGRGAPPLFVAGGVVLTVVALLLLLKDE